MRSATEPRAETNWKAVRERVERLGLLIRDQEQDGAEAELLRRRARSLARPRAAEAEREAIEAVVVEVGGERYGLESRFVIEAFRSGDVAILPGAAPPLVGLVPWRGEVLRVLDLQQLMGRRTPPDAAAEFFVIVGSDGPSFAVPVHRVLGVERMPRDEVRATAGTESTPVVLGTSRNAVLLLAMRALIHSGEEESK